MAIACQIYVVMIVPISSLSFSSSLTHANFSPFLCRDCIPLNSPSLQPLPSLQVAIAFSQDLQSFYFFVSLRYMSFISHAEITCLLTFHWSHTYTIFLRLLCLSWQSILASSRMLNMLKQLTCLLTIDSLTSYIQTLFLVITRVGYFQTRFQITLILEVLIHPFVSFKDCPCPVIHLVKLTQSWFLNPQLLNGINLPLIVLLVLILLIMIFIDICSSFLGSNFLLLDMSSKCTRLQL